MIPPPKMNKMKLAMYLFHNSSLSFNENICEVILGSYSVNANRWYLSQQIKQRRVTETGKVKGLNRCLTEGFEELFLFSAL